MSYLNALLFDLRERKLWPLAAALLAALVAVPVLMLKGPATPARPQTSLALPVKNAQAGPTVSLQTNGAQAPLKGGAHDPFIQQQLPGNGSASSVAAGAVASSGSGGVEVFGGATGASAGSGAAAAGATGATGGPSSSTSTVVSSGGSSGGGVPSSPGAPVGPSTPRHGPSAPAGGSHGSATVGLSSTEAYVVSISRTLSDGGVTPLTPKRDSVLPSAQEPLLVELGVLQGGKRVLFAVLGGTKLWGPGTCTPGPLDCEILSLAPGQTEQTWAADAPSVLFAVTGISAQNYGTAAAARRARTTVSATGQKLIQGLNSEALSLFPFDAGLGALVDLRNLTVGGN